MRRVVWVGILVMWLSVLSSSGGPAWAVARTSEQHTTSVALFQGRWIDLAAGWGAARECVVAPARPTQCFRTHADARVLEASVGRPDVSCSTPLRLYDGTSQTGAFLYIYTR